MFLSFFLQITDPASTLTDTASAVATAVAPVATPAAQPAQASLSLLDMIAKGGFVMIPVGILSILAIYVFVERLLALSKAKNVDANFIPTLKDHLYNGNLAAAKSYCHNHPAPAARMVEKGVNRIGKPIKEVREAMEDEGKSLVFAMERNLNILNIIGRIAPMFGFIGTIMGVIKIFYNISLADNISIGLIAGGLYEKMVTSASGLVVGVFAFAAYHILNIIIEKKTHQLELTSVQFLDLLNEPQN